MKIAIGNRLEKSLNENARLNDRGRNTPVEMPDSDVEYVPISSRIIAPLLPARLRCDGDGLISRKKGSYSYFSQGGCD